MDHESLIDPSNKLPAVVCAASMRSSHVSVAPKQGLFTSNTIYTIEEPKNKLSKRAKAKQCRTTHKTLSEIQEESYVLRRENHKLDRALKEATEKTEAFGHQNEELQKELYLLRQNADWGKIIRGKDEEVKKLNGFIRKMSFDKAEALNGKSMAEQTVGKLKSKLRNKSEEMKQAKEMERIQSKERILVETEKLRSERDNAVANLNHLEALVTKLRQERSSFAKVNEERKMAIQELQKRLSTKDKQVAELRKQLAMSRLQKFSTNNLGIKNNDTEKGKL